MECMEEGYLAKIVRGDGSKEIKVGEVLISFISLLLSSLEMTFYPLLNCLKLQGSFVCFTLGTLLTFERCQY